MGQYTPNTFSDGTAITASALNTEFSAIATELNALDSSQFHSSSAIPNNALAKGNWIVLQLGKASIANGQQMTDIQSAVVVPRDCKLTAAKASAATVTDGTETVDVYLEDGSPATIFSGAVTLAAGVTNYDFTLSTTSFSENDVLSLRVDTNDGTEAITGLNVVLYFEPA